MSGQGMRDSGLRSKKVALAGAVLGLIALACALAGPAAAENSIVKKGGILVTFSGQIAPSHLPRTDPAPVSVQMGGKIKSTDHSVPPKLERIILKINSHGKIQTKGLPTCSLGKLNSVSAATAKRSCKKALIGHGNVTSRVSLPSQPPFASNGGLLAFNGKYKGHPAVFAQVESGAPLPLTYVIVFEVKKTKGTFGTELVGTLPAIASEYGYITAFNLSLGATYRYHGKKTGYAQASCPAPKGVNKVGFPFAEAAYQFAGGLKLAAKIPGQCTVRGK
jgi:hypothetical protein